MLYIEPQATSAPIVQIIESAKHTVNIGVYYFTDPTILQAIKTAIKKHHVKVQVIIASNPEGISPLQLSTEEQNIRDTGAALHLAPSRFAMLGCPTSYYHAKYVCNGHECEIGTANLESSAFQDNREYLYVTQNPTVVAAVNGVFQADWTSVQAPNSAHNSLVLSPEPSSSQMIQTIIDQPGPVDIETDELGDYTPILDDIQLKGSAIRILLPASPSLSTEDQQNVALLQSHGCQVRFLPDTPAYLHATMIVGDDMGFIGSENFTGISLNDNREMGVVLGGNDLGQLQAQFDQDWSAAQG